MERVDKHASILIRLAALTQFHKNELVLCPFCNSSRLADRRVSTGPFQTSYTGCTDCNYELPTKGWNIRPREAALIALVQEAAGAINELREKSDAEMERVKACEHIAEGDEGWEKVSNLCPSTVAIALLRRKYQEAAAEIERLRKLAAESRDTLDAAIPCIGRDSSSFSTQYALRQAKQQRDRCELAISG